MTRKQFNLTRTALLTFASELDDNSIDVQADYFDTTIRWHLGHALVTMEKFLFRYPVKSENIPAGYAELFSSGTSPKDWTEEPPSLETLLEALELQQQRINEFNDLFWKSNVQFKVPFGSVETQGDLLIMLSFREAELLGKIKGMYQVISRDKNE
ncbi:formate dehydrogenase [Oceanobacillus oncorhynchi subsp. incaldanensis]|uniref:DinB superfamily protein n=2 Tax=Oceanobacillus TaxID=182709 RepID=A0A0A1MX99_9BACI|nr:DinB family protein [Oceanobacillus oncorhynchi]MDM8099636.1 DinB family protein [Oceanobacillus oncorhynchi]GIO19962.1 formate dehydrogenase [Oceanobacillus oncorhynchi subsp. incaldanensis]CEI83416.1 DinB superfamily protein [Oceanobacillus oncorhynchi]